MGSFGGIEVKSVATAILYLFTFSSALLVGYWVLWFIDSGVLEIGLTPVLGVAVGSILYFRRDLLEEPTQRRIGIFMLSVGFSMAFIVWSWVADRPHPMHVLIMNAILISTSLMLIFLPGKTTELDVRFAQAVSDANFSFIAVVSFVFEFEGKDIALVTLSLIISSIHWISIQYATKNRLHFDHLRLATCLFACIVGLFWVRLAIEYHLPWNPPKWSLHPGTLRIFDPLLLWFASGSITSVILSLISRENRGVKFTEMESPPC
jgi:hypothetical protein